MPNEKNVTGVRIFVMTVDEETNELIKAEEENPATGERSEVDIDAQQLALPSVAQLTGENQVTAGIVPVTPRVPPPPPTPRTTIVHSHAKTIAPASTVIARSQRVSPPKV